MDQAEKTLTEQEKALIVEVIGMTQLSPKQPNAVEIMKTLQSIIAKLTPEKEGKEEKS